MYIGRLPFDMAFSCMKHRQKNMLVLAASKIIYIRLSDRSSKII